MGKLWSSCRKILSSELGYHSRRLSIIVDRTINQPILKPIAEKAHEHLSGAYQAQRSSCQEPTIHAGAIGWNSPSTLEQLAGTHQAGRSNWQGLTKPAGAHQAGRSNWQELTKHVGAIGRNSPSTQEQLDNTRPASLADWLLVSYLSSTGFMSHLSSQASEYKSDDQPNTEL